jgi:5-methylcytosine-specific restriction endonuclease McrA
MTDRQSRRATVCPVCISDVCPPGARRCPDCQVGVGLPRRKAGTVTHNPRYANGYRRRHLRAQVLAEEDLCQICGRRVDKDLPFLDPWSPVIDEIIPISKGGSPYERDNVRLAHRRCNARRGNGTRQRAVVVPYVTARRW